MGIAFWFNIHGCQPYPRNSHLCTKSAQKPKLLLATVALYWGRYKIMRHTVFYLGLACLATEHRHMCFKWLLYICYLIPISQIYLPHNVRSYVWILFVFLENNLSPDYSDCWSWNWNLEKAPPKKIKVLQKRDSNFWIKLNICRSFCLRNL